MTEPEMYQRMREIDQVEKLSWAEKGSICWEVEKRLLHRERIDPDTNEPCSFPRWVHLACPWGYGTAFQALRDVKALSDVPPDDLAKVPVSNVNTLKQISTAVRAQPDVIKAAQTKRSEAFAEHIEKHYPGQHISAPTTLRFVVDKTQLLAVDEALRLAMEEDAATKSQALVAICIEYWVARMKQELQEKI